MKEGKGGLKERVVKIVREGKGSGEGEGRVDFLRSAAQVISEDENHLSGANLRSFP